MKLFKRLLLVLTVAVLLAYYHYPKLDIISGYASKNMASSVFIAKQNSTYVKSHDNDIPIIKWTKVISGRNWAKASIFGLARRKAVCREGLGCVLVNGTYDVSSPVATPKRNRISNGLPFPYGNNGAYDTIFQHVDYGQLEEAIDAAFSEPHKQRTRSVLVVHQGQIIGERYADGFTSQTPALGWSMAKSILATLYGILYYKEELDLQAKAPIASWKNDKRKNITLNHLLRMQSGLEWSEDYTKISDVTRMLFWDSDMSAAQEHKEVVAPPTEIWNYSSGTTNLLSGILRAHFDSYQDYLDFPYTALIDKIGMHSMLLETDMDGNFVCSSYGWANTRDWAKFGQLYLNRGRWNGEQIFAPEWVDYVTRPTKGAEGNYGAHFWLNAGGKYPDAPKDMYSANGFLGQRVFIIPSKDLVIVRTGLAESPDFDFNQFLKEVLAAIK